MTASPSVPSSASAVHENVAPDTPEAAQHPAAAPKPGDAPPQPPPTAAEELRRVRALLWAIAVMLVLVGLYFAAGVMVPFAAALLLNFLFKPAIRRLESLGVPPTASAIVIMATLLAGLAFGAVTLAGSLHAWMEDLPRSLQEIRLKFESLRGPLQRVNEASAAIGDLTAADAPPGQLKAPVQVEGPSTLPTTLATLTSVTAAGLTITFFLALFLMASGDLLLRQLVQWLPRLDDKKEAVEAWRDLEAHVSVYLVTVTAINIGLGTVTAGVMWLLGVPHAIWWGAMACVANYVPYIGPLVTAVAIFGASVLVYDSLGEALVPPLVFMAITGVEGNFITPTILGRRLSLNPLIVFAWLVFWGWLWGVPGALLAVPMLVCFKIVCDHVEKLEPLSNLLSGYVRKAGDG